MKTCRVKAWTVVEYWKRMWKESVGAENIIPEVSLRVTKHENAFQ